MAESVFLRILSREGVTNLFEIDSAGLLDYHQGELADKRMQSHAFKRGYSLTHRSRPVNKKDFDTYDWIICMDNQNIRGLKQLTSNPDHYEKIHLMTTFCRSNIAEYIPDPYSGDDHVFEQVIDLLEDACEGLYTVISKK